MPPHQARGGQRPQHVVDGLVGHVAEIRADRADDRVGVGVRMVVHRGQHRDPRTRDAQGGPAQHALEVSPHAGSLPGFWNQSSFKMRHDPLDGLGRPTALAEILLQYLAVGLPGSSASTWPPSPEPSQPSGAQRRGEASDRVAARVADRDRVGTLCGPRLDRSREVGRRCFCAVRHAADRNGACATRPRSRQRPGAILGFPLATLPFAAADCPENR